ncbi:MAG: hypothetical protein CMJ38_06190 [Phycisphaerae bacterium]|nr:hypothetical protein [Phycisphaerae bacterium]
MFNIDTCTVYNFHLPDHPGVLLAFANRLRTADIPLKALWAQGKSKVDARIRCIPERDPQFRDFAQSAELELNEEIVVYITAIDSGGEFHKLLERIASANININEMQAVNFGGETGWMIWTDEEQIEPLIESIR